jgi:hypothetical protein
MPKNVIITPATGLVEFKGNSGNTDATIQLDDSGNLKFTSPNGDISIGDTTSDIFVGDGVNSVDIIFEQNGDIRALAGKTLTLGQANSNISIASPITSNITITGTATATRFISTQATGTAPFDVSSTTVVTNLNADLLDGLNGTS